ncbi:MAG: hypothetical protein ACE14S_05795 [Candidatus Bathyarchaeia archaeon]
MPATYGQESVHHKTTYAFVISAVPNPVGVGEQVLITVGITDPLPEAKYGWEGLTVTITKPDNTSETRGPIRTDSTGMTGIIYVPTMVGTYRFRTNFPAQWSNASGYNILYEASTSKELSVTVQEEKSPNYPGFPLPTEYWTRPIDSQLREWSDIATNWLASATNRFIASNNGPESAHILWAKPLSSGGLVGGDLGYWAYEIGDAYEQFFSAPSRTPVVINGNLYYNRFKSQGGTKVEQEVVAVDLHTGEELWVRNWNNTLLMFGQVFHWASFNYAGSFAYLWTTSGTTWNAYEAISGRWIYSMTNVPSGTSLYGPNGEIIRYTVNTANGWITMWNSTKVVTYGKTASAAGSWISGDMGTTFDASRGIEWNKTIPVGLPGSASTFIIGDMMLGFYQGSTVVRQVVIGDPPFTVWGVSLKPGQEGTLLFNKTHVRPMGNISLSMGATSKEDRVFTLFSKETRQHWCYSLDTGELLWGPTESQPFWDAYVDTVNLIAYSKLFSVGWSGIVHCYNVKTGGLLWTYEAKEPYNEIVYSNNWPLKPLFITDGKIYLSHSEHSPNDPKPRGSPLLCLDVETGKEVWSMNMRGTAFLGTVLGDGIMATLDGDDQRIYALGKGPTATTVTAPDIGIAVGDSIVIAGTVTDISPGTEEYALRARFPNGVPAVSEASMSDWMKYVYNQFPHPANAAGVEVTIDANDPNGNFVHLGRATSDANGFYSLAWQAPDVPGKYTIIVTFAGSESYYASYAETALVVTRAPSASVQPTSIQPTSSPTLAPTVASTPTPAVIAPPSAAPNPTEAPNTTLYVGIAAAVVIIVVATVAVIFRKRK